MMKFSLILIWITGIILSEVKALEDGHVAQPTEFPYIAKVCYQHAPQCSGLIYDETHIIVLASCFGDDFNAALELMMWSVAVGSRRFGYCVGLEVENIRFHPGRISNIHDIAIMKLAGRISMGPTVQPIQRGPAPTAGCPTCRITGWMSIDEEEDEVLAWTSVHVFSPERCIELGLDIGETETCFQDPTARAVITNVDLGSSVVCDGVVVGMIMEEDFGLERTTPHAMILLSPYMDFISNNQ